MDWLSSHSLTEGKGKEGINLSMIRTFRGKTPQIAASAFVEKTCV
jgi:hypothetical protein